MDGEFVARRAVVRGRVQGVFFRDSTRREARAAGATGWACNDPDGSVRLHVEGPPDAVERVLAFVRTGPPRACVEEVEVSPAAVQGLVDFRIG